MSKSISAEMPDDFVTELDKIWEQSGYSSRSSFIKEAVRTHKRRVEE